MLRLALNWLPRSGGMRFHVKVKLGHRTPCWWPFFARGHSKQARRPEKNWERHLPGRISKVMVSADGGKLGFGRTSGAGTEHGVHSLSYAVAMDAQQFCKAVRGMRTATFSRLAPNLSPRAASCRQCRRCSRLKITISTRLPGLPPGSGTSDQGASIFAEQCSACHGEGGKGAQTTTSGAPAAPAVVSDMKRNGIDDTTLTIANYWPYATTLFDYIRRSMPWTSPRSLTDDQVYAPTAYILAQTKLIDAKQVINAQTLPKVQMPNRNGFIPRFPERMPHGQRYSSAEVGDCAVSASRDCGRRCCRPRSHRCAEQGAPRQHFVRRAITSVRSYYSPFAGA
jgi:S-disulfanyl-L-cysteine oxidoreductase SoxD